MRQPLALREPAELREHSFAEWLTLVKNLEQKIIAVLFFNLIKLCNRYNIIFNNHIIGKECGVGILIPRSWQLLPDEWETQKQRWRAKRRGH